MFLSFETVYVISKYETFFEPIKSLSFNQYYQENISYFENMQFYVLQIAPNQFHKIIYRWGPNSPENMFQIS